MLVWLGDPQAAFQESGDLDGELLALTKGNWEDGIHMKNTGKRIFAAIIVAALATVPFLVSAGSLVSSR